MRVQLSYFWITVCYKSILQLLKKIYVASATTDVKDVTKEIFLSNKCTKKLKDLMEYVY